MHCTVCFVNAAPGAGADERARPPTGLRLFTPRT